MRRALLACLVLPVVLFGIFTACAHLLAEATEPIAFNEYAGLGGLELLLLLCFMCALALPALLAAIWFRWLNFTFVVAVCSISGFLAFSLPHMNVLLDTKLHGTFRLQQAFNGYPFVLIGALAGSIFWLIAAWRNPAFNATGSALSSQAAHGNAV